MSVKVLLSPRLFPTTTVIVGTLCLLWMNVVTSVAGEPAVARQAVDLTPHLVAGDIQQVKIVFELDGTLSMKSEAKSPVKLPVRVKAQLRYDEKVLQVATGKKPLAATTVRHYETAKANIKFRDTTVAHQLREERLIIGASAESAEDVVLFSPLGPLTRDELDLIDVPANSAIVDGLLPYRTVSVGESWKVESDLLPAILGVDAISRQDIKCTLKRIDGNLAVIHAQGSVSAATDGVATEFTLAAKFSFDRSRRRVSWFAMSLKENRSMGHAQPGISATVRLQMALTKRSSATALHADILADLNLQADESSRLIEFASPSNGFELLVDRKWHEMLDRQDVSVLRMVDRGDLIAQCNISALPPMEDGVPFTLVDFQQDVQKVLDKDFGEFITATEEVNESGLHVMRVVANGNTSGLAINWVYYHITNDQGRRVSCVFTYESDLADRFGAVDRSVISSFRFRTEP